MNYENDLGKPKFCARLIKSHMDLPNENFPIEEKADRSLNMLPPNKLNERRNTDYQGLHDGINLMKAKNRDSLKKDIVKCNNDASSDSLSCHSYNVVSMQIPTELDLCNKNNDQLPKINYYYSKSSAVVVSESETKVDGKSVNPSKFTCAPQSKYANVNNQHEKEQDSGDSVKKDDRCSSIDRSCEYMQTRSMQNC